MISVGFRIESFQSHALPQTWPNEIRGMRMDMQQFKQAMLILKVSSMTIKSKTKPTSLADGPPSKRVGSSNGQRQAGQDV